MTAPWLEVDVPSGTLGAGGSVDITVALNANAAALLEGTHTDTVTFTNVTSGFVQTRGITLDIGSLPCTPDNPSPADTAIDLPTDTALSWSCESAPSVSWGTYLGGTGEDYGQGIAVDTSGNA